MKSIPYDSIASEYDRTRGGLVRGRAFATAIVANLPDGVGPILDVGVGTAAVATPLGELSGRPVVGVDFSQPMLQFAHERLGARVARADAVALPIATGAVDAAVLCWVIHVIGDVAAAMREVHRCLRPGGTAFVAEGDPVNLDEIGEIYTRVATAAGRPGSEQRVARALDSAVAAGFEIDTRIETVEQPFEQSPADMAATLRARLSGFLVDLDDEQFAAVVQPGIDELMALPDPERKRVRRGAHHVHVLRRA